MGLKYVRSCLACIRLWICVSCFALVPGLASAVTPGQLFNTVSGQISGTSTVLDFAANGAAGRQFAPAAAATLASDGAATLALSRQVYMPNASGVLVPVNVAARVPASAAASLIAKAIPLVGTFATGVALYDLAKQIGYSLSRDNSGNLSVSFSDPSICTVAPCYEYSFDTVNWFPTPQQACASDIWPGHVQTGFSFIQVGPPINGYCVWDTGAMDHVTYRSASPKPATYAAKTILDLQNAIASSSGWPSTSKIADAVSQAQDLTGQSVTTNTPTVTGPATSTGPTTTTTNADGTKLVSTPTYNHTYNGNTINTTVTTTNNTYNTSNQITSTTSVSTAAPPNPQTDCDTHPNSVGCVDIGSIPASDILKKSSNAVSVTAQAFAAGGACPSPLSFAVVGRSYAISYQPLCDRMALLRTLFLALAGVVAAFVLADSFRVT
jgi:Neisseria meningitidis TspB protein